MDDSGDDLFITQSTFKKVDASTQDANEAANFLLECELSPNSRPEVVQYWDFSNDTDTGYKLPATPPPVLAVEPPDFEEDKVCHVFISGNLILSSSNYVSYLFDIIVLNACFFFYKDLDVDFLKILDNVEKEYDANSKRFGQPVEQHKVDDSKKKKYVSFFKHF